MCCLYLCYCVFVRIIAVPNFLCKTFVLICVYSYYLYIVYQLKYNIPQGHVLRSVLVLCITHAYSQAIERCTNRISLYLFRRGRCKTGRLTRYKLITSTSPSFAHPCILYSPSPGSDVARFFAKRSSKWRAPSEISHTGSQTASACLPHCQEMARRAISPHVTSGTL